MSHNNVGIGPIQPKTGDSALAIDRIAGYEKTLSNLHDETKTGHPHVDRHYRYEALGDLGGSLHLPPPGYTEKPPQGTY